MRRHKKQKKIALIGLDGSGKSANIEKMRCDSDLQDFSFLWVRWKPFLLKPAYLLVNRKVNVEVKRSGKNSSADFSAQKDQQAVYRAKSNMKEKLFHNKRVQRCWLILALLDYLLQFYVKSAGILLTGKNVIFDRYYVDLFVDQGINFGYHPEQIAGEIQKYEKLFPRQTKMIYIRVSPEICYQRKTDIPDMGYLEKRYAIYEYLSHTKNWRVVDGEQPFEKVYRTIKLQILKESYSR